MSPLPFDPIRPDRLVTDLPSRGQGDLLSAAVPRIPTAKEIERLLALGLYYNEPEPAVLCIRCGFALKTGTDRVSRHLGEKHGVTRKARRGLNRLVRSLQLPEPAQLARRPDGSAKHPVHPHLVLQKGASCKHCSFRSASLLLLSNHLKRSHRHVINANPRGRWLRSHVNEGLLFQGWLANDIQSAWIVVTDRSQQMSLDTANGDDDPISRALQRHVEEICAQERQHIASKAGPAVQIDLAPEHAVMMTNWMRRTGWEDTFRGACRGALVSLAELPVPHLGPLRLTTQDGTVVESSEADEKRLAVMVTAVDRLFNRCGDTTRALEALWCDPVWDECRPEPHDSTDAASWSCSESDSQEEEEEESWDVEVSDGESIEAGGRLSDDDRTVSDRPGVQQDPHADTILRFCYHMATEDFEDGRASSTLLIYFSAVCGLSVPDGAEFLRPGQYTTHLAGLIYCVRLIMLESVLPCASHDYIGIKARPRRRQLDVLQPLRRDKMCDGSVSPLGEMLSLLAFGNALRKSDGSTFHFEWSDDGEEVSWDGECHLTMDAFRGLVRTVLEAASQTMQRLMYGLEPPRPDFRRMRDRLSSSRIGYSFITDPANGLACEYLKLLTRACLSPIDGLLRRDARGESSWDLKAVTRYIEGHDELLKILMLLFHLGGGQGSRITELLTVEHCNTASRLRGIGIFAGRMFTITRHHKARLTTNNEFHVARFLPGPIAAIAYNYLVFIRGATYMLRRTCLNQGQDETVLFTPAAKRSAWRTDVLSRELRHFSRISPGLSFDIGARLYRQLSIAITERHVRAVGGHFNRYDDTSPHGDPGAAFAWQSGHRPRQRHSTYGLDGAYPGQLQPALLQLYLQVSQAKSGHDCHLQGGAMVEVPAIRPSTYSYITLVTSFTGLLARLPSGVAAS
ncbi:hypothetical protein HIM_10501 [Hirsutella minnesotensis 3608]|uniref:Uncharacterized protein n=1 Tax=Hirsutella minnesotensis 3608 TaxID=1043627 RepID=A0A0F7ZRS0_9HYPO|nr:hypothetical protein HIM_10501 [Hirsutella minnesotensis 3608]